MGDENNDLIESKGVVKFFNDSKGFGFVFVADDRFEQTEGEVFIHQTKIEMSGHRTLVEDQHVTMFYRKEAKGFKAEKVIPDEEWIRNNPDKFEKSNDRGGNKGRYGDDGYGSRGGGGHYGGGYGGQHGDHYQYGNRGGGSYGSGYGSQRYHDNSGGYGEGYGSGYRHY